MLSYHNSQQLKDDFLGQLVWHQDRDRFVQRQYWRNGKGCAVGCSLQSLAKIKKIRGIDHGGHYLYEKLIGVPAVLAQLEDSIFEGMSENDTKTWPIEFAQAIPVGVDLSLVWPRFVYWLLVDPKDGVVGMVDEHAAQLVLNVADLHRQLIEGHSPTREQWERAKDDLHNWVQRGHEATSYALSCAENAIREQLYYDECAARDMALYAAHAHWESNRGASEAARRRQADKLIELLQATAHHV